MKLQHRNVALTVVLLGLLAGCGPTWTVLRASEPTALASASTVAVEFDYSEMLVEGMPAQQWTEQKTAEDPTYPQTWADLTIRFEDAVLKGLQRKWPTAQLASEGSGDVTLTIRPIDFRMGKYIGVAQWPTVMEVVVGARAGDATEDSDEIAFGHAYEASIIQPSVFQHISPVGELIGTVAGNFLSSKQKQERK